ncbi:MULTISPECIES: hypothetical protein [unclassified Okeania]|uniref:hypothetical protein n=1 Tax=unclassified Okeania TaxID=2634635 RepID=UPI0013BDF9F3|nr:MULTISPECIES: hypothetical protein [unclassified Okeania]NES78969.1 hypothetical protein [Okeania sp. SIO1H4]NET11877.1 hypothetical protein [Okeania sp. SIO1H6]NET22744.1 hypothetical protein [Okeania sp. SIO1H5]NET95717.1 hypothetical protein [Okeania sp. SIO1H2]
MSDPIKLTPEDIALYREQFSQNNQKEALYALDVIEEENGNLMTAASELATDYNIVVSKSVPNILEELAKKSRNIVCDEEFIDEVMAGLLSAAVASLCATGQIPEAVAAPLVIYLAKKGIQKWCNSHTEG